MNNPPYKTFQHSALLLTPSFLCAPLTGQHSSHMQKPLISNGIMFLGEVILMFNQMIHDMIT